MFRDRGQGVSLSPRDLTTSSSSSLFFLRTCLKISSFPLKEGMSHTILSWRVCAMRKVTSWVTFFWCKLSYEVSHAGTWAQSVRLGEIGCAKPTCGATHREKKKIRFRQHSRSLSKATGSSLPTVRHPRKQPFFWLLLPRVILASFPNLCKWNQTAYILLYLAQHFVGWGWWSSCDLVSFYCWLILCGMKMQQFIFWSILDRPLGCLWYLTMKNTAAGRIVVRVLQRTHVHISVSIYEEV